MTTARDETTTPASLADAEATLDHHAGPIEAGALPSNALARIDERRAKREKRYALLEMEVKDWPEADLIEMLTERYAPSVIPPCRVCGGELSLQACGSSGPNVWACVGDLWEGDRRVGWQPGRSPADEHFSRSRIEDDRAGGDELVMEFMRRVIAERGAPATAPTSIETPADLASEFSIVVSSDMPSLSSLRTLTSAPCIGSLPGSGAYLTVSTAGGRELLVIVQECVRIHARTPATDEGYARAQKGAPT